MASVENFDRTVAVDADWGKDVINDIVSALHDVGQNVRMISWQTGMLQKDGSLSESAKSSVGHISNHITQLVSLLDEVNAISRKHVRRDLVVSRVTLPDDLNILVDTFRSQALSRGLAFTFEVEDTVPASIFTDLSCLRRIISNLINNAIKFTDAGSISLFIGYRSDFVEVLVTDSGQGIPVERQSEIFWPYNHQLTESHEGTGLGLFGAKMLANRVGGDLNLVSSSPGRGSIFRARILNRKEIPDRERLG